MELLLTVKILGLASVIEGSLGGTLYGSGEMAMVGRLEHVKSAKLEQVPSTGGWNDAVSNASEWTK